MVVGIFELKRLSAKQLTDLTNGGELIITLYRCPAFALRRIVNDNPNPDPTLQPLPDAPEHQIKREITIVEE